mmetsp:Transcript_65454/g.170352  ORF Transcript_65454/g.170352 Transcript_65454/m.170352 type:complete len:224 (+) Transcript_65454:1464-2135(+)
MRRLSQRPGRAPPPSRGSGRLAHRPRTASPATAPLAPSADPEIGTGPRDAQRQRGGKCRRRLRPMVAEWLRRLPPSRPRSPPRRPRPPRPRGPPTRLQSPPGACAPHHWRASPRAACGSPRPRRRLGLRATSLASPGRRTPRPPDPRKCRRRSRGARATRAASRPRRSAGARSAQRHGPTARPELQCVREARRPAVGKPPPPPRRAWTQAGRGMSCFLAPRRR